MNDDDLNKLQGIQAHLLKATQELEELLQVMVTERRIVPTELEGLERELGQIRIQLRHVERDARAKRG